MKEAILFDLDGTLIDSVPDLADAVNAMLMEIGKEPFEEKKIRNWVGNGATMLVKRALSGSSEPKGVDEELFQKALQIFFEKYENNLCNKTSLYPGVKETLSQLHTKYPLAIITNKPHRFVRPILESLGIDTYFSLILGGDSLPEKKPHPKPLLHACERLSCHPKNSLMVGDSKNDIIAAKEAGIPVVAVDWGYNYDEPLTIYQPDYIIKDFTELEKLL
ncbi:MULTISPECIES: phosphoglycolate phosphatase [unclassified Nitratiruptor]|uniref:phosphoglycolate phosphatase n=1 Tax=unclassified Nitratiruptor TaxID=2624044 RepID=UPI001915B5E3|nr:MULTISPECIES: phosphoglycolate phosphatase [unclassified Nitratiruptor]BCD59459.1 phosphoglycolate phosphatase [Nitratiruptor sp. YY08-10]BCD63383.1 phosphoglycolate phosphatase [Nitratiruptor sp. YY08-14]